MSEEDTVEDMRDRVWMACETYYNGMIKWPSFGGSFLEFQEAIEILQAKDASQIVTVGLRANCDERVSYTDCCTHMGEITGLLHILGGSTKPATAEQRIWDKVVQIDLAGRQKGFYTLDFDGHWLVILKD